MRRYLLCTLILFVSLVAVAQQDYVGRFDFYSAYSYLDTPGLKLGQHGWHTQTAVNLNRWLAFGVDYSRFQGSATLVPTELKPNLRQELGGLFTPPFSAIPNPAVRQQLGQFFATHPNYSLSVPFDANPTWEFAVGPSFQFRKIKHVTLFIHPDLGVMHETAKLKPRVGDLPAQVAMSAILPSGKTEDTVMYYGVGAGADLLVSKNMAIRAHFDYVHYDLFKDLLNFTRNSYRYSIGPRFNFGGNVKK